MDKIQDTLHAQVSSKRGTSSTSNRHKKKTTVVHPITHHQKYIDRGELAT